MLTKRDHLAILGGRASRRQQTAASSAMDALTWLCKQLEDAEPDLPGVATCSRPTVMLEIGPPRCWGRGSRCPCGCGYRRGVLVEIAPQGGKAGHTSPLAALQAAVARRPSGRPPSMADLQVRLRALEELGTQLAGVVHAHTLQPTAPVGQVRYRMPRQRWRAASEHRLRVRAEGRPKILDVPERERPM